MDTERGASRVAQLDAVRGIAILLVLVNHYFQWTWGMFSGRSGVILFFILSGYLITGILLRWRARIESGEAVPWTALKSFYLRRSSRIFPAFYLVLGCAFVLGVPDVRQYFAWHAAYLSNLLFALRGDWLPYTAHLWSLAVEEQFYLVWPLLIWRSPRRWLLPLIAASIALAPAFRLLVPAVGLQPLAAEVLPFGVTDALGIGALLACMRAPEYAPSSRAIRRIVVTASAAGFAIYWLLFATGTAHFLWETLLALAFSAVALAAIEERHDGPWRALTWRPLVALGRISYGVYLIHLPITYVLWRATTLVLPPGTRLPLWVLVPLWSASTIALAALSWRYFEQPILRKARSVTQSHSVRPA